MEDNTFIFLAGLHRSGTSLLHEILREHSEVSGFSKTGAPEDEGQHLQAVYEPAKSFGGPGKFAFDQKSYMDESHSLATNVCAKDIFEQWSKYYDLSSKYLIEKSPPNIIRTRYLQRIFSGSKFIVILRHPIAVSYATQKWSNTSVKSLINHSLHAYEIFLDDMRLLNSVYVLRYEDFVCEPQETVDTICRFLDLSPITVHHKVRNNINEKYFSIWKSDRKKFYNKVLFKITPDLEARANRCGYSLINYNECVPVPWLGSHNKANTLKR
ncbi:MAG: hypothetical protein GQ582_06870 [Methyloprofundus sp.]|nr:hypothetical protein [Methyloprofundus sp.]